MEVCLYREMCVGKRNKERDRERETDRGKRWILECIDRLRIKSNKSNVV